MLIPLATVLAGALFFFTPYSQKFEEDAGLDWLFHRRGSVSAPDEVVIIGMDRASSQELELSNKTFEWPRDLHARMVEKLAGLGTAVIVYDIRFEKPGDAAHDRRLIEAIRRAGNLLLFQYLDRPEEWMIGPDGKAQGKVHIERLIAPIAGLESAAAELAPYPLPRVPIKINQSWLFKGGAGDVATLPIIAFLSFRQSYVTELWQLIKTVHLSKPMDIDENEIAQVTLQRQAKFFRNLLLNNRELAERFDALFSDRRSEMPNHRISLLRHLLRAFTLGESHYLNYYGPTHTIKTLPFHRVLSAGRDELLPELEGKVVFIGLTERLRPEQPDCFYTVFTSEEALDICGVEIMATAFSNLLQGTAFNPLRGYVQLLIFTAWGIGLCLLFRFFTAYWMLPVGIVAGLLYLWFASYEFEMASLWIPLIIPLVIQLPVALTGSILWRYRKKQEETNNIKRALSMYIPSRFVDDLAENIEALHAKGQIIHGACLATDAGQYTRLAEFMELEQLHNLMNQYYKTIFEPIRRHDGNVSDVIGDAVLAVWATDQMNKVFRAQVCESALGIGRAVESFNQKNAGLQLPTRMGLHCGQMLLGNVGAMDHYEFRALGDIVNTSTRIEGLNKILGTRILAAGAITDGLDQFVCRELGLFRFMGKTQPLEIFELITHRNAIRSDDMEKLVIFNEALGFYHKRMWRQAAELFQQLCSRVGGDGPSSYYLKLCDQYSEQPPDAQWSGISEINTK